MRYLTTFKQICRIGLSLLTFFVILNQIALGGEPIDPLDRLCAEQSQRFDPAYIKQQQIANEELIDQKDSIEALMQYKNDAAAKSCVDTLNSTGINLMGPKRASAASRTATMASIYPVAMDSQETVKEILSGSGITMDEYLASSDASQIESWLIDCGSSTPYVESADRTWVEDENFYSLYRWGYAGDFSTVGSTNDIIMGTDLSTIYQTYRRGGSSYKIDMPNGDYKVTLMFAEIVFDSPGQRLFDVALEGDTLWQNVDIYSLAEGHDIFTDLTKDVVTVNDYCLDITFPVISKDLPIISGIKVEAVDVSGDAFLDFIQRKMFWFYLTETNPATGLVKWGENNWTSGYGNVSSIASDGMALSIYTLGIERGWMTEDDGYTRTMHMLDSFDSLLENTHGFWYHYVQMDTGERADASEVSTVDSSLFIMGALQSGEYFKDTHPDVALKAKSLYERMDWTWFTGRFPANDPSKAQFVNMGWKPNTDGDYQIAAPEGGYFCNYWWDGYSESFFVDLLAIASPLHAINVSAWDNMSRNWQSAFGYTFIQIPQLFAHQYQQLYFDLTDKTDAFADYFLNTQLATLANRQTCMEDSRYDENIWGLTSCGGPLGYKPYGGNPGGYNDGTVAPTAPGASLIFTSEESISALRRIYFQYKDLIWGLHGFSDSFNASLNFKDWAANALDNGAMILGIENFRSGLIKNTFMQNQYMQDALALTGFTDNSPVATSSVQNSSLSASFAFDGDISTRWSSQNYDTPQWLEYDFGSTTTFHKVTINWEAAYAKTYKIQVSNNRINWTDLYQTSAGNGGIDQICFDPVDARYIRMYATERGTEWAYSIWEMTVENSGYYKVHLPEVAWSGVSESYRSTGAAACQMLLNFIRDGAGASILEDQDAIYEYARGSGLYDGSELTPDEIDRALGHYDPYDSLVSGWADTYDSNPGGNPYQGYNYGIETFNPDTDTNAMHDYLLDICHWISYPVTRGEWWQGGELTGRPFSPAIIPLYGTYENWAVITGFIASANPCPDPIINPFNTPDVDVRGFWIYDPSSNGVGQDVYMSAAELVSKYLRPMRTGDRYDGLFLQIAEPPLSAR